ncbi:MAG: hypothetical protein KC413_07945, partial [Anaerolineales bacterium]|nr:hypothetical protein [Anaerolineales bacterium]
RRKTMHDSSHVSWRLLLASFVFLLLFSHGSQQLALADHTAGPTAVAVAGSLQDELGCPGDWQPECSVTAMTMGEDGLYVSGPFTLTAGDYEVKVALDGSWTTNYGVDGEADGANYPFSLAADGDVSFVYDPATNLLEIVLP